MYLTTRFLMPVLMWLCLAQCTSAYAQESPQEVLQEPSQEPPAKALVGGVAHFEPHSLIGRWNGHIRKFHRHPKLFIDRCDNGTISGTYKGIFGRFPVSGNYDEQSGDITINVDLSASPLARLRKLRSGHGLIQANIKDGVLIGTATIPDLGPRTVKWEAVKAREIKAVSASE